MNSILLYDGILNTKCLIHKKIRFFFKHVKFKGQPTIILEAELNQLNNIISWDNFYF